MKKLLLGFTLILCVSNQTYGSATSATKSENATTNPSSIISFLTAPKTLSLIAGVTIENVIAPTIYTSKEPTFCDKALKPLTICAACTTATMIIHNDDDNAKKMAWVTVALLLGHGAAKVSGY